MTNNDVIRRLSYAFNLSENQMQEIFTLTEKAVTVEQISFWLKKEDDTSHVPLKDIELAAFLNGFIILKRSISYST